MKFRWTAAVALAALTAVTFAGCGGAGSSSATDRIKKAGKVVMTTNAEFEPFEYKDGDEITGIIYSAFQI